MTCKRTKIMGISYLILMMAFIACEFFSIV